MDTQTQIQPLKTKDRSADAGRREYRFTARQFWRMIDAGILEGHVELIAGRIYRMTKDEPHNFTVLQTAMLLRALVPTGFYVREEKSMRHGSSDVLEPDVAVTPGSHNAFRPDPPTTSEAALIAEVCASTRTSDYRDKARLYASAGVPVYWIVDVEGRKLDVFTLPEGSGSEARYAKHDSYLEGSPAPVVIDGREVGRIDAKDLLPPIEIKEPSNPQNPPA